MLFAKLIFLFSLLDCEARRVVSHFQNARNALASCRQVLGTIQREISMGDDEDGKDITKYVTEKVLEKCKKLKQEEVQDTSNETNSSSRHLKETWKEQLKLSNLCEQHGDKIITTLSKQMQNPGIATWICTQGFELAEVKIDEKACKQTSELLLGGLQDIQSSQDRQERLAKLGLYLVRAAVILTPLPGPLGWILDKATEKLLQKLTKDAEEALDNLEKLLEKLEAKMWDTSRKVVAEEFLRVGGEQVKVAEDQVKDIESIKEDDLWNVLTTDAGGQSTQVQTMIDAAKKATSFNRWAAIEQSLATTLAILRPPAFMETSQEMEPFIKVMKIHFEIEVTVLSHMFKVVENKGKSFTEMVVAKAHRAALSVLPYLFIIDGDQTLLETLKSPLLRPDPKNPGSDPCSEDDHSLVCVWLGLLSDSSHRAKGFQKPRSGCERRRIDAKYFEQTNTFDFGTYGPGEGFGVFTHFVNSTDKLLNFKCGSDDQYIAQWQEIHDESKYFGKDTVAGRCVKLEEGQVKRHLKFTSTGSFCPTMLTYGDVSVGELVSVKFEEDPQQNGCGNSHGSDMQQLSSRKMKSSSCYISNIYLT